MRARPLHRTIPSIVVRSRSPVFLPGMTSPRHIRTRRRRQTMSKRIMVGLTFALAVSAALAAPLAWAANCTSPEGTSGVTVVDLTSKGATGTVNGAIFTQIDPQSTGSGVIDPFVRINPGGSDNCEQGFNTSHRK